MPTSHLAVMTSYFAKVLPGSFRETKVFGFWGKYGCKAETPNARKHPAEYNEQLPSKRTTKWSDVEKGELARAEVQIRGGQARNINQMLHEKFPHRTVQAISTRRKAECHKSLVNELMLEEITMNQGRGVEARSRAPSPQEANADLEAEPNLRNEHPC